MNTAHGERYHGKMGEIQQMLILLQVEAEHATVWKEGEEIDASDIAELEEILSLLVEAYRVFCADAVITRDEVIRRAEDMAGAEDGVSRYHGAVGARNRYARSVTHRDDKPRQYRYDGVDEDGQHWLEVIENGEPTERYVPIVLWKGE